MKLQNNSRTGLSLALGFGLSAMALVANAHEGSAPSTTSPDASQSETGEAPKMQHHYPHGQGYEGHHGKGEYSGHHGTGGHGGRHHGMMGSEGMRPGPVMDLGFDEDQLEEIAEIQQQLRSELMDLKVERYEESLKLQQLYAANELDADDIVDQQQRVFDVIKEITELQVEAQQDIRDLLTTEQKTQLSRSGGWLN